jgi:hypothetical protein
MREQPKDGGCERRLDAARGSVTHPYAPPMELLPLATSS